MGHHKFHETAVISDFIPFFWQCFLFVCWLVGFLFVCLAWKVIALLCVYWWRIIEIWLNCWTNNSHISIWHRHITLFIYQLLWPDLTLCLKNKFSKCGCKVFSSLPTRIPSKSKKTEIKVYGNDHVFFILHLLSHLWYVTLSTSLAYTHILSLN